MNGHVKLVIVRNCQVNCCWKNCYMNLTFCVLIIKFITWKDKPDEQNEFIFISEKQIYVYLSWVTTLKQLAKCNLFMGEMNHRLPLHGGTCL